MCRTRRHSKEESTERAEGGRKMGRGGEGSGEDGVIVGQLDKIVCMYGIVYICTTDYKNSVLILGGWGRGSRIPDPECWGVVEKAKWEVQDWDGDGEEKQKW